MNVLVTGGWYEAPQHLDEIRELGYNVFFIERESDDLPCNPEIIDGIICCKVFNWHPIEEFTNLKFIQTESVGYDRVPTEYCKEHEIQVHNVKDTYSGPMSEYIICHLLEWYQRTKQEYENRKAKTFIRDHSKQELTGKKVCIIGTGNIAKKTARKLAAFDCEIVGITHTVRDMEFMTEVRPYDRLTETLAESDIVIIATSPTGKIIMGSAELAAMRPSAILVNVSRGTQLDEAALITALRNNAIAAAILDVYQVEPLPAASALWDCENAILTPHSSYIGEGNAERLWQVIKNTLLNYIQ